MASTLILDVHILRALVISPICCIRNPLSLAHGRGSKLFSEGIFGPSPLPSRPRIAETMLSPSSLHRSSFEVQLHSPRRTVYTHHPFAMCCGLVGIRRFAEIRTCISNENDLKAMWARMFLVACSLSFQGPHAKHAHKQRAR